MKTETNDDGSKALRVALRGAELVSRLGLPKQSVNDHVTLTDDPMRGRLPIYTGPGPELITGNGFGKPIGRASK